MKTKSLVWGLVGFVAAAIVLFFVALPAKKVESMISSAAPKANWQKFANEMTCLSIKPRDLSGVGYRIYGCKDIDMVKHFPGAYWYSTKDGKYYTSVPSGLLLGNDILIETKSGGYAVPFCELSRLIDEAQGKYCYSQGGHDATESDCVLWTGDKVYRIAVHGQGADYVSGFFEDGRLADCVSGAVQPIDRRVLKVGEQEVWIELYGKPLWYMNNYPRNAGDALQYYHNLLVINQDGSSVEFGQLSTCLQEIQEQANQKAIKKRILSEVNPAGYRLHELYFAGSIVTHIVIDKF